MPFSEWIACLDQAVRKNDLRQDVASWRWAFKHGDWRVRIRLIGVLLAFVAMTLAFIAFCATLFSGCVVPSSPYGYQSYSTGGAAQNAYAAPNNAGGPVGRVAAAMNASRGQPMFVNGAGSSVYEGSRYDPRTDPAVRAFEAARQGPMIVAGGGMPTGSGASGASPTAANPRQLAVSVTRVNALSRQVGQIAATQQQHTEQLRAQGRLLGQVAAEQHEHRHHRRHHDDQTTDSTPPTDPPITSTPTPATQPPLVSDGNTIWTDHQ